MGLGVGWDVLDQKATQEGSELFFLKIITIKIN